MSIEIINPIDYPGWDNLLLTNEQTSFFHTSAWAKVLLESYKYQPLYFVCIENRKLSALLPLMSIKSFLTGKRGVSLPFTDECPIFFENMDQQKAFFEAAIQFGKVAGWKYIELRNGDKYLLKKTSTSKFISHSLNLTQGEEKIISTFRSSTRRNIKKAIKGKVKCKLNNSLDAMKEFYRLNCLTRKMHGLPPQPWRFFNNLFSYVIGAGKGSVFLAAYHDKIIAGAIYLNFNKQSIFKYGASERQHQKLRANNLVMWEAIRWYAKNGITNFSLGRTEPANTGLLQYKRGWGGEERLLHYYKYDIIEGYKKKNNSIKSSCKIFRFMPLPILRLTGNFLYRHVG